MKEVKTPVSSPFFTSSVDIEKMSKALSWIAGIDINFVEPYSIEFHFIPSGAQQRDRLLKRIQCLISDQAVDLFSSAIKSGESFDSIVPQAIVLTSSQPRVLLGLMKTDGLLSSNSYRQCCEEVDCLTGHIPIESALKSTL